MTSIVVSEFDKDDLEMVKLFDSNKHCKFTGFWFVLLFPWKPKLPIDSWCRKNKCEMTKVGQ